MTDIETIQKKAEKMKNGKKYQADKTNRNKHMTLN